MRARASPARAAIWKTVEVCSPAILNMFGIMRSRPWLAVKVVVKDPACSVPWTVPAAPPSLCISRTVGVWPQMFFLPSAAQASAFSPMFEEGVMG